MKLAASDYFLCRLAHRMPALLKHFGDIETDLLRARLDGVSLDRPVFIAGLARSGTTILLNLFARLEPVGTHRYRDFPFLFSPCWWSWCTEHLSREDAPIERPHRDRITITKNSPDAFEEPLWRYFFPFSNDPAQSHVLTTEHRNAEFESFFRDHLRKILLLRGKTRYVSKGNYNLTRLDYLGHLFPDARFVVPIRHPIAHVGSLVGQHNLFSSYGAADSRVPEYLRTAGHFEFGPQRQPINVEPEATRRIRDAWAAGQDALGYAISWRVLYGHAHDIASRPDLAERMTIVRYEDLCADPSATLEAVFDFCGFGDSATPVLGSLPEISASAPRGSDDADAALIWSEVEGIAEKFGYAPDGSVRPRGATA